MPEVLRGSTVSGTYPKGGSSLKRPVKTITSERPSQRLGMATPATTKPLTGPDAHGPLVAARIPSGSRLLP